MESVDAECACTSGGQDRRFGDVSRGYTQFVRGDVLVAKITPCFENAKIATADIRRDVGVGSTEFHVVRPQRDRLDPSYLLHYLRRSEVRRQGELRMTGSAGQRRVPEAFLASLMIPLPSLDEQRRIARVLDAVDALRAKRRMSITKLSEMVEATFVDMFGDPRTNERGWPVGRIGDMLASATYGSNVKAGSVGAYPVLRMGNITSSGRIDMTDLKYLDLSPGEAERYLVRAGDVLFNRTNSPNLVGKTAIYRGSAPLAFAGYLIRLRMMDGYTPDYLSVYLNTRYGKAILRAMCKSIIGMANINAQELKTIPIPIVPAALQEHFSRSVWAIEQERHRRIDHLAHLDTLFASLRDRAFKREL